MSEQPCENTSVWTSRGHDTTSDTAGRVGGVRGRGRARAGLWGASKGQIKLAKFEGHALQGLWESMLKRLIGVQWYGTEGTGVRYRGRYGGTGWYGTGVRSGGYGGAVRGVRWYIGCVFCGLGCVVYKIGYVFSKFVVFFGYGAVVQYGGYGGTVRGVRWYAWGTDGTAPTVPPVP